MLNFVFIFRGENTLVQQNSWICTWLIKLSKETRCKLRLWSTVYIALIILINVPIFYRNRLYTELVPSRPQFAIPQTSLSHWTCLPSNCRRACLQHCWFHLGNYIFCIFWILHYPIDRSSHQVQMIGS